MSNEGSETLWPEWCLRNADLVALLKLIEEEARTRGHSIVSEFDIALGITRPDSPLIALMRSLDLDPLTIRDRMNFVLGVNAGISMEREKKPPPFMSKSQDELHFRGPLQLEPEVVEMLEAAKLEADKTRGEVEPRHLFVAQFRRGNWQGVKLAKARKAANIPHERRVLAQGADRTTKSVPKSLSPIILCGGGEPDLVYQYAVDLAAESSGKNRPELRIECVFAAIRDEMPASQREHHVLRPFSRAGAQARDVCLNERADASSEDVLGRLGLADLVFFCGGRAELLFDAIFGTPAVDALVEASDRGAVMMGSSAGAMIWGEGYVTDWESGDEAEPLPLLGWFGNRLVIPHYMGQASARAVSEQLDAYPGAGAICVAHQGAILAKPGWKRFRNIEKGFAEGSAVIDDSRAIPIPIS